MTGIISFMAAPFTACLLLLVLCGYLGQHVLKREIIFIDIALAQVATLGATAAVIFDFAPHSPAALALSMLAVALASALFALTRYKTRILPQEAVIGVVYAFSAMLALLMIDQVAGGHEHVNEMLAGSILWVCWGDVARTGIVFVLVGALHLLMRKQFDLLSSDYERAKQDGRPVRLWDFLFYFSFGAAMVFAVQIAGILLIFAFLIIPASISTLLAGSWKSRLAIAWITGALVSIAGLSISWKYDLQCGPTLVCLLGCALAVIVLLKGKKSVLKSKTV